MGTQENGQELRHILSQLEDLTLQTGKLLEKEKDEEYQMADEEEVSASEERTNELYEIKKKMADLCDTITTAASWYD